jgi:diguanylate cyclase (GGDEF)-like protein
MGSDIAGIVAQVAGSTTGLLLSVSLLALLVALVVMHRLQGSRVRLRSNLQNVNSELEELRSRDPLTGLLNRGGLEALLELEVNRADQDRISLSLVYLGLDGFRPINEAYGMRVGDALLVAVAQRLRAFVGHGTPVARIAGDEFVLLIRSGLSATGPTAVSLLQALGQPFQVGASSLQVTASIGVACYPDHASRPRLLCQAALAMRAVKHGGGNAHALYDPTMGVTMREHSELLQDLRLALARDEFQLLYQPKIDARTLQITAVEGLLRWQHPRRGLISPELFVPLAEKHGLICELGLWVIEEACRQAAQWREAGLRMRIAINLSGHQLRREDLAQQIETSLARHHIPPNRLTCEITETVAMEDTRITRDAFERLRRCGLHLSIDDFGTGYSSLAALRKLPAAELKVDRAFVQDLATSEDARSIVRAIVQMAHSLQLRVVAEGVETEAQRDVLLKLGCDELQGYLFAKPMTATMLALWADGDNAIAGPMFRPSLFDPTAPVPLAETEEMHR